MSYYQINLYLNPPINLKNLSIIFEKFIQNSDRSIEYLNYNLYNPNGVNKMSVRFETDDDKSKLNYYLKKG